MQAPVRYQVFLSSTYTDLKEERAEIIQALWELDCIPTGMEAFLASNANQWDIIKAVIEQTDYYILVIGGRYGSLSEEGLSYTQREYNLARDLGKPILAFVHGAPDDLTAAKSELDQSRRDSLAEFRDEVKANYPVREYLNADQLGSLASRSLIQEIRRNPQPGWIKNVGGDTVDLLQRIDNLSAENIKLREQLATMNAKSEKRSNYAFSDEKVLIEGSIRRRKKGETSDVGEIWSVDVKWTVIYVNIAPLISNEGTEESIKSRLADFYLATELKKDNPEDVFIRSVIWDRTFSTVLVQFQALGFIEPGRKKRSASDTASYWKLTEAGHEAWIAVGAKRKSSPQKDVDEGAADTFVGTGEAAAR